MNKKESLKSTQTGISGSAKAERGLTAKHVVLILGALVIVTSGLVAAVVLTRQMQPVDTFSVVENSYQPVVNADNLDDVLSSIHEKVDAGMFETHMNMSWTFPDSESASTDAVMGNSKNNNFPFWFDVTVNNEVVYKSDLLPVGTQVKEIILEKKLDAGTYPAVVTVHMVDDKGKPIDGNMGLNISLTVLK